MSAEMRGVYIQLLAQQWHRGGTLRDDDAKLQRWASASDEEWTRSKARVLEQFERKDGLIYNAKLRALWDCKARESEHKSVAGKHGVRVREQNRKQVLEQLPPGQNGNHPVQAKRGTQLPDDFVITDAHRKLAAQLQVDADTELPAFIDHHKSKGTAMKDWNAAFRTWLRNAVKFGGRTSTAKPTGSLVNPADLVREELTRQ